MKVLDCQDSALDPSPTKTPCSRCSRISTGTSRCAGTSWSHEKVVQTQEVDPPIAHHFPRLDGGGGVCTPTTTTLSRTTHSKKHTSSQMLPSSQTTYPPLKCFLSQTYRLRGPSGHFFLVALDPQVTSLRTYHWGIDAALNQPKSQHL